MKTPTSTVRLNTHRSRLEFLMAAALTRRGKSRVVLTAFMLSHKVTPDTFTTEPARTIARIVDQSNRNAWTESQETDALRAALSPAVMAKLADFKPRTTREARHISNDFFQEIAGGAA